MQFCLLTVLLCLVSASIDPIKAEACVTLSNDFLVNDAEAAKTIATSKYSQHDTMKKLTVDVLIYCYNHISPDIAMGVIAGQYTLTSPEARSVCKYRKTLFETENNDISLSASQEEQSKLILEAVKSHKKRRPKPQASEL